MILVLSTPLAAAASAHAATHTVCSQGPGGGCGHGTIQSAVDASSSGDTVVVSAGTFSERVVVAKRVTIRGAQAGVSGRERTGTNKTIVSAWQATTFTLSHGAVLDGVDVRVADGFTYVGIDVVGAATIRNVAMIAENGFRVRAPGAIVNIERTVIDGQIYPYWGGGSGIDVEVSGTELVVDDVLLVRHDHGIYAHQSGVGGGVTVRSSTFTGNLTGISGDRLRRLSVDGSHFSIPGSRAGIEMVDGGELSVTESRFTPLRNDKDEEGIRLRGAAWGTAQIVSNSFDSIAVGVRAMGEFEAESTRLRRNRFVPDPTGDITGSILNESQATIDAKSNWFGCTHPSGVCPAVRGSGATLVTTAPVLMPLLRPTAPIYRNIPNNIPVVLANVDNSPLEGGPLPVLDAEVAVSNGFARMVHHATGDAWLVWQPGATGASFADVTVNHVTARSLVEVMEAPVPPVMPPTVIGAAHPNETLHCMPGTPASPTDPVGWMVDDVAVQEPAAHATFKVRSEHIGSRLSCSTASTRSAPRTVTKRPIVGAALTSVVGGRNQLRCGTTVAKPCIVRVRRTSPKVRANCPAAGLRASDLGALRFIVQRRVGARWMTRMAWTTRAQGRTCTAAAYSTAKVGGPGLLRIRAHWMSAVIDGPPSQYLYVRIVRRP
ncbi:MAG: hypothetical protein JWO69_514 [Thermoleophilia bacterium]|nr:hypothetical protein [Thermoleophilia bacterium]